MSGNDNPVIEYGNDVEGSAFCPVDAEDPLGSTGWNLQAGSPYPYHHCSPFLNLTLISLPVATSSCCISPHACPGMLQQNDSFDAQLGSSLWTCLPPHGCAYLFEPSHFVPSLGNL